MYVNSGYMNGSRIDFKDKSHPLIVGSCGTYHLYKHPRLPTWRPKGRIDFQLLYIAAGKAHFYFKNDKEDEIVTAGHMVLYRPREMQKYVYYCVDQTEVYWVHFTGSEVKNILRQYGIPSKGHVFYTGTSPDYQWIFRQMILELQMCRPNYEELLSLLLRHIFLLINRHIKEGNKATSYMLEETERATRYFNENYNKPISIEEYALSRHVSACWFIRKFKYYTGISPMQYVLSIRIANAQNLLETTSYTVAEIADIIGYDNPLYFSRLFKKQLGMSPTEYRKKQTAQMNVTL
ncbi:MAG: AraC family transcriptional regulator [Eubacteriales bacterium]|nr:AraC family transcriptional regulator [Eubacteriales bacterium]